MRNKYIDYLLHPCDHFVHLIDFIVQKRMAKNLDAANSLVFQRELIHRTLTDTKPGVSDAAYVEGRQVIVSLTSHGQRIYEVSQAIESIMQGTFRPNRIVLWLSKELEGTDLPHTLCLQQRRGLEIRYTTDLGPHTKLLPSLMAFPEDVIITIDDDVYYPFDMVENLVKAHRQDPTVIWADRVAIMDFTGDGFPKPYFDWQLYQHPEQQTVRNFIIGSEGCLYPPHCLHAEVTNAEVFRKLCATADDVWFTAMAILRGTPIYHLFTHYDHGCAGCVENYRMQENGLIKINEKDGAKINDQQIQAVFEYYQLNKIFLKN